MVSALAPGLIVAALAAAPAASRVCSSLSRYESLSHAQSSRGSALSEAGSARSALTHSGSSRGTVVASMTSLGI